MVRANAEGGGGLAILSRSTVPLIAVGLGLSVVLGSAAAGQAPTPLSLPIPALIVVAIAFALLPVAIKSWQLTSSGFFVWLVVEDLVRKLAGNDLRVYFVKDALFLLVLVALAVSSEARGAWRCATRSSRYFLYALITWAIVASIRSGADDWRLPVIGLRLYFLYIPLVAVGYLIGQNAAVLRRWLIGLALLAAVAGTVGTIQAIAGPSFLSPKVVTPGLRLVLIRGVEGSPLVFRPTGTFVDGGRFASQVLIGVMIAAAATFVMEDRLRWLALGSELAAGAALWVSGGRAPLMAGALIIAIAIIAPLRHNSAHAVRRVAPIAVAAAAAVLVVAASVPTVFEGRLAFYRRTLDPRSSQNEWASRWRSYGKDALRGVTIGQAIGRGTGRESLGRQYLYGGASDSTPDQPNSIAAVESGYGSVAVEMGVIGLALWIAWSIAWAAREWRVVRTLRTTRLAGVGLIIFGWMTYTLFIIFFAGLQNFQNYLANAYFWLLSGVIFGLPMAARESGDHSLDVPASEEESKSVSVKGGGFSPHASTRSTRP